MKHNMSDKTTHSASTQVAYSEQGKAKHCKVEWDRSLSYLILTTLLNDLCRRSTTNNQKRATSCLKEPSYSWHKQTWLHSKDQKWEAIFMPTATQTYCRQIYSCLMSNSAFFLNFFQLFILARAIPSATAVVQCKYIPNMLCKWNELTPHDSKYWDFCYATQIWTIIHIVCMYTCAHFKHMHLPT